MSVSPDHLFLNTIKFLSKFSSAIIETVLYGSIFKYPLTVEEIAYRLRIPNVPQEDVQNQLNQLVANGHLYCFGRYYYPFNTPELAPRRDEGNAKANKMMLVAKRIGRFIYRFPFVRSVMISGSLSKNYMDKNGDLDFFLITKPGRLWVVKAIMVIVKKVFLLNSHKYFCVNYLIDQDHLEIEEQNPFTATEIITVIPVAGRKEYAAFWQANRWVAPQYPNAIPLPSPADSTWPYPIKRFAEWLLSGKLGTKLEKASRRRFDSHTAKKYKKQYSEIDYNVAFKANEHVSKYHEKHFQRKVTDRILEQKEQYEKKHGVVLS